VVMEGLDEVVAAATVGYDEAVDIVLVELVDGVAETADIVVDDPVDVDAEEDVTTVIAPQPDGNNWADEVGG
jgi:hypothetical protein